MGAWADFDVCFSVAMSLSQGQGLCLGMSDFKFIVAYGTHTLCVSSYLPIVGPQQTLCSFVHASSVH